MIGKQQTRFARIGGNQLISALIHNFYDRVVAYPELKPFFKNASMEKIRRMQRESFSAALDGPTTYTGKPLGHVHRGRGITKHHFALYVGHLIQAFEKLDINEQDVQNNLSRINTHADEITGTAGSLG